MSRSARCSDGRPPARGGAGLLVILVIAAMTVGSPRGGIGADRSGEVPAPPVRVERALHPVDLPQEIDGWSLQNGPNRYNDHTIFDYMNGGAEIFIGYRYGHLDVYEYGSAEGGDLVVEIYTMKGSDDAYGLQSMDRSGQCLDPGGQVLDDRSRCLHPALLYGHGYLRQWAGERYARLLAYEESEASKQALLALARIIAKDRAGPAPPSLVASLVEGDDETWRPDPETIVFVRSHLVLDSFSRIDPQNLLGLGLETEAVRATYRSEGTDPPSEAPEILLIRYPSEKRAAEAEERFRNGYAASGIDAGDRFWEETDGWCGARLEGADLAVVRAATDRAQAESLIASTLERLAQAR